ncbi:hypothetical protein QOT17_005711, partial [Balamuthia mandrillaris]
SATRLMFSFFSSGGGSGDDHWEELECIEFGTVETTTGQAESVYEPRERSSDFDCLGEVLGNPVHLVEEIKGKLGDEKQKFKDNEAWLREWLGSNVVQMLEDATLAEMEHLRCMYFLMLHTGKQLEAFCVARVLPYSGKKMVKAFQILESCYCGWEEDTEPPFKELSDLTLPFAINAKRNCFYDQATLLQNNFLQSRSNSSNAEDPGHGVGQSGVDMLEAHCCCNCKQLNVRIVLHQLNCGEVLQPISCAQVGLLSVGLEAFRQQKQKQCKVSYQFYLDPYCKQPFPTGCTTAVFNSSQCINLNLHMTWDHPVSMIFDCDSATGQFNMLPNCPGLFADQFQNYTCNSVLMGAARIVANFGDGGCPPASPSALLAGDEQEPLVLNGQVPINVN